MIIELQITKEMIDEAEERLRRIRLRDNVRANQFGFTEQRIIDGYIGERLAMDFLGIKMRAETYEYDLRRNGKRLEVKTIRCKSKPKPHYFCTVNSCKEQGMRPQDADFYIFLRILEDRSKGWLLGWISCKEFFEQGQYFKKGETYGHKQAGALIFRKANATVLEIRRLNKFKIKSNEVPRAIQNTHRENGVAAGRQGRLF